MGYIFTNAYIEVTKGYTWIRRMGDRLPDVDIEKLGAKLLFFLAGLISLYNSIVIGDWVPKIVYLIFSVFCGVLIVGAYDYIKFTFTKLIGMEIEDSGEDRTINQVQDLLRESEASNVSKVSVNEKEGTTEVRFDR